MPKGKLSAVLKLLKENREPKIRKIRGKKFIVLRNVFDPFYFDSKLLAKTIKNLDLKFNTALDLGTGSGIQAIMAASKVNQIDATDISQYALDNAKLNIVLHNLQDRINLIKSDLFSNIDKKYDLIIFNPPFFSKRPRNLIEKAVTSYKSNILRRFFKEVKEHLNNKGKILIVFSDVGDIDYFNKIVKENFEKVNTLLSKKYKGDNYFIYLIER